LGVNIAPILERQKIDIGYLAGKRIAVDAYNTIYQFLSAIREQDGRPLSDRKGRPTSHLIGILYRNSTLLSEGVKPAYVFDGIPSSLKAKTLMKRSEIKRTAEQKYREAIEAGDTERAHTYAMQTSRLTEEMIIESRKLLELMGIPHLTAPEEGEAQASVMAAKGDVWAVASQDYDSLLFGAPRLVRNITISGRRKVPGKRAYSSVDVEIIELRENLARLKISREQLIDIGILVGTDFNEGVRGIGPKKALSAILKYGNLEGVPLHVEMDYQEVRSIREIFSQPRFTEEYRLEWKAPDIEGILKLLCEEHDFSKERVMSALAKLNSYTAYSQNSLDGWN